MDLIRNNIGEYCSETTDIWTLKSQHAFISFTAHFQTKQGERKTAVLRCFPCDESHRVDSIAKTLHIIVRARERGELVPDYAGPGA